MINHNDYIKLCQIMLNCICMYIHVRSCQTTCTVHVSVYITSLTILPHALLYLPGQRNTHPSHTSPDKAQRRRWSTPCAAHLAFWSARHTASSSYGEEGGHCALVCARERKNRSSSLSMLCRSNGKLKIVNVINIIILYMYIEF